MLTWIVIISNSQVSPLQSPHFCVIQDTVAVAVKRHECLEVRLPGEGPSNSLFAEPVSHGK